MGRKALGRGLGALIPQEEKEVRMCPVEDLRPGRFQPRRAFDDERLEELTQSIKEKGIIQPLLVRRIEGSYEIVAGERRWRAALRAGLKEVPVQVIKVNDRESLELALVENLQREDLNPIEEAEGYKRLIEEFGYSHEEVATRVGKDRATISNALRLLRLPQEIKEEVVKGKISAGHARALLSLGSPALQIEACRKVVKGALSVRETERLVKNLGRGKEREDGSSKPSEIAALEEELKRLLGTKVEIKIGSRKGRISIEFYSLDELERILEVLKIK